MTIPTIPTPEQCSARDLVYEDDKLRGYACWYPQMGGYVGRAIALFDKEWIEYYEELHKGEV